MNLKAFVSALELIPSLLPLVDQVVQSVETSLSALPGAQKLAAAEAKLNTYLTTFEADVSVVTDLKAILTPLVNAAVAAFNAADVFKHGAAKPA